MQRKLLHIFKDDRKYFAIVFFILFTIIISAFVTPVLMENKRENWNKELSDKVKGIESQTIFLFKEKENEILAKSIEIKRRLSRVLSPKNISYGSLIKLVSKEEFKNYSIEIIAPNGKLIAWNEKVAIPQEEIFPLYFPAGEAYFYNTELLDYFTVVDTIHLETDLFYFIISLPIDKHYSLQNPFFEEVSFTKMLSNEFYTQFEIDYNPFQQKTKDGRKYSFEILNKKNNKIGLVTFVKPALDTSVNSLKNQAAIIQSLLVMLGYIFLGFGLRKDYKEIPYRTVRLILFTIYCGVFRVLLYFVGIPSNIIEGSLVEPAYFSSAFAGGIVKSPMEFFITNIFILFISVQAFRYLINYLLEKPQTKKQRDKLSLILVIPLVLFFLITLRGLIAAIRSVIFDSTLRYFKEPDLLPNIPAMVMNLNILVLGISIVLLLCGYVILSNFIIEKYFAKRDSNKRRQFFFLFAGFQIFGVLYVLLQRQPLITPLLNFFFISLVFALSYQVFFIKMKSIYNYVYAALAASVITISLLNYFNLELERESLKTTALEINRPDENLLRFMVMETLSTAAETNEIISLFSKLNTNYNAAAFLIWSNSSLQRESLNSSVIIYDRSMKVLGRFFVGINAESKPEEFFANYPGDETELIEVNRKEDESGIELAGITPIKSRNIILGYISVSAGFDLQNLGAENIPDFLESKKNIINSVIDLRQLNIFEIVDSKLNRTYGDIYPSRDQIKPILNANYSDDNEAWLNLILNEENCLVYALKSESDGIEKITAVSLQEKHFSLNLFNFFKIFIIHIIFILILFVSFFLLQIKRFKYSFRAQLQIAFLLISIVPVVILAVYNRQIVYDRTQSAIFNELNERTNYLVSHIQSQINKDVNRDLNKAFENAGRELQISFSVYETTNQIFNSKEQYYNSGLFTSRINPEAYYHLNYLSYREYLTKEEIENYQYDSFYRKLTIDGKSYILGVNDAFNKVKLTFSTIDIDVFLFGVYSFAALIIIIISTILANNISAPIRRLTKATGSVAHGDFNVELGNKERGEVRELLDGFNSMTKELQKNQAELAEMEREIAWKEMAKQVAHEIKNPLTPMKLAIQQLIFSYKERNKNFDSIFEKVSATILNQIENLSLIASEFSRFGRMPNYKLEELDLIPVINDTVNLFLDEKIKIGIDTTLNSALIEGDKTHIRRLLINLIRNSIQADATLIKIIINWEDGNFSAIINDKGKGIPDEIKDKIFEVNFTTKEKGMGLGLKLAKRFLEGINGSIQLVNSSSSGTTFKITIPMVK